MYSLKIVVDDLTIVEVTSSRFEQIQAVQERLTGLARDFETEAFQKLLSLFDDKSDKKATQEPVIAPAPAKMPEKKVYKWKSPTPVQPNSTKKKRGRPVGSTNKAVQAK